MNRRAAQYGCGCYNMQVSENQLSELGQTFLHQHTMGCSPEPSRIMKESSTRAAEPASMTLVMEAFSAGVFPELDDHHRKLVERVLEENCRRGRADKFTNGQAEHALPYVQRVISHYLAEHEYVRALQIERADEPWAKLYQRMARCNYRHLTALNYPAHERWEFAQACAADAVPVIQTAHFPFDVPFDAWATVIVLNVLRQKLRSANKSAALNREQVLELDELVTEVPAPAGQSPDLRMDLLKAMQRLNPARQEVIQRMYVDGLSASELAAKTGRSLSSIYNLHYYAIQDLRKMMQNWINDE